ncbi:hypothetical protein [Vulcanisaeta moutnovskia]|nr:hypothetical protein [Vulcanisaeta moutnovskia]
MIYISQDENTRHPELIIKVCEVLMRLHEETVSEDSIERAWRIAKVMKN